MLSCEAGVVFSKNAREWAVQKEFGETQDLLRTLGVGREEDTSGRKEKNSSTTPPLGAHLLIRVSAWPNLSGSIT